MSELEGLSRQLTDLREEVHAMRAEMNTLRKLVSDFMQTVIDQNALVQAQLDRLASSPPQIAPPQAKTRRVNVEQMNKFFHHY